MGKLSVIDLSLVADYKPNPNPPIRFQPYIGDIVRKGLCEVLWELCCNRRYESTVCMYTCLMHKNCSKILHYVVKNESHSGLLSLCRFAYLCCSLRSCMQAGLYCGVGHQ